MAHDDPKPDQQPTGDFAAADESLPSRMSQPPADASDALTISRELGFSTEPHDKPQSQPMGSIEAALKAEALAQAEKQRADDKAEAALKAEALAQAEKQRADDQLGRAERLVYAGKLSLAQSAFAEGNGAVAIQHLEECQWNLRGWEHDHLWTRFNSKQTLRGHTERVTSVAWSPDGRRIVTASEDRTAKVWEAEKG